MKIESLKYNSPYSCYINLTSKCNLRCKHCFGAYGEAAKNELDWSQWQKVIDDLIKSKVFFVNVSGGEPTQSPYFKNFLNLLSRRGIHFILTTNGIFSKEIKKIILDHKDYLIGIKISLDGPDAKSYGFLRLDSQGKYNPHLFKIALRNIYYFKRKKIPLTIASVLHTKNINKIEKLAGLIKKISPVSWFISPIIPVGRGNKNRSISKFYEVLEKSFWDNLMKKSVEKRINIRFVDSPVADSNTGLSSYECAGALNFCEIHSDGTVSPCSMSRVCIPQNLLKFENLKNKSLSEIWYGKPFEKFRSFMDKGCPGCKMLKKCNKCVAQSFKYFKNGYSPTPFCIKNGKHLKLKQYSVYKKILSDKFNISI